MAKPVFWREGRGEVIANFGVCEFRAQIALFLRSFLVISSLEGKIVSIAIFDFGAFSTLISFEASLATLGVFLGPYTSP